MPKTQEFISSFNITTAIIGAIFEALISQSAYICYFLMILSQFMNAGLISICYPFAVFGYALMEEARPGRKFWRFMKLYTLIILCLKFILQLSFWDDTVAIRDMYQKFSVSNKSTILYNHIK